MRLISLQHAIKKKVLVATVLHLVNIWSVNATLKSIVALTAIKISVLLLIILTGILTLCGILHSDVDFLENISFNGTSTSVAPYASAFYYVSCTVEMFQLGYSRRCLPYRVKVYAWLFWFQCHTILSGRSQGQMSTLLPIPIEMLPHLFTIGSHQKFAKNIGKCFRADGHSICIGHCFLYDSTIGGRHQEIRLDCCRQLVSTDFPRIKRHGGIGFLTRGMSFIQLYKSIWRWFCITRASCLSWIKVKIHKGISDI